MFRVGSDVEMLALCSCLAGKCVREGCFGAFGVVKCCNHGPDALSCACAMYCMLQGSRKYILDRLSHRGSVVVSEKAGTGRQGRLFPPWLGSELGVMAGSMINLHFMI